MLVRSVNRGRRRGGDAALELRKGKPETEAFQRPELPAALEMEGVVVKEGGR